jgi:5-methylcytosine-specific restriction endonuclease McrA
MQTRINELRNMDNYMLGILLLGSTKPCDAVLRNDVMMVINERNENIENGVFGGPKAAKELPHDTVIDMVKSFELDTNGFETPQTCACCGTLVGLDVKMKQGNRDVASLAICHIVPKSRGGATAKGNLFLGCAVCNQRAGNSISDTMIAALSESR